MMSLTRFTSNTPLLTSLLDNLVSSTGLMKPIILLYFPPMQHHSFVRKLPLYYQLTSFLATFLDTHIPYRQLAMICLHMHLFVKSTANAPINVKLLGGRPGIGGGFELRSVFLFKCPAPGKSSWVK